MTAIEKLISTATVEIGYVEKKSNSQLDSKTANAGSNNYTKYARDLDAISGFYNGKKQGYAWCDVFTDWCFVQTFGVDIARKLLCQTGGRQLGAGCKYSMGYYKNDGKFYTEPKVGDQIFFYNSDKTGISHTGIVYQVGEWEVFTIEGNAREAAGVTPNGGMVCAKKYTKGYEYIAGYGRPDYSIVPEEKKEYVPTVFEWQRAAMADGFDFPEYGADDKWGKECESVAKKAVVKKQIVGYKYPNLTKIVQKVVGVNVDGKCGNDTKNAIIIYQKAHGLTADGCVGFNTWKEILKV